MEPLCSRIGHGCKKQLGRWVIFLLALLLVVFTPEHSPAGFDGIVPKVPRAPLPLHRDALEAWVPTVDPIPKDEPFAPSSGSTVEGVNMVDDGSNNSGFRHIPPDPCGAAGPNHLVHVANTSIEWHTKAGTQQNSQSLSSFFSALSPVTNTFDPKVLYDQHADRFVVVTLEVVDSGVANSTSNKSYIMVAVSDDSDPNGTWYFHKIDSKMTLGGNERWADYPGFAVDDKAVYITNNMFGFTGGGGYAATYLWIIHKGLSGGFYDNGAATVTVHNPPPGGTSGGTTQPAHIFGTAPGSVGTWLVTYSGLTSGGNEYLRVVRVDDPVGTPSFNEQTILLGNIDDTAAYPVPGAPQNGTSTKIATNDRRALNAVWRDDALWVSTTVVPPSGADSGQATAHWIKVNTSNIASLSVSDQGNAGGEDIVAGASTFFPAVNVDKNGNMAIGFSLSASSLYCGAYYTGREASDPAGTVQSTEVYAAGTDYYIRTFGAGVNRWGDYTSVALDPSDEETFWVFNQYAMTRGNPSSGEYGQWATRFASFTFGTSGPTNTPTQTYTPTNTLTPTPTLTPTQPEVICASVISPENSQTVWGNQVTVKASVDGPIASIQHVQFQVRVSSPPGSWTNIGVADTDFPYYALWDATSAGANDYDLRAVVRNVANQDCSTSSEITVTASSTNPDVLEDDNGGDHLKTVAVSSSSENIVWSGDQATEYAARVLIPSGALSGNANLNIEFKDSSDYTSGHLDSYTNMDAYVSYTLSGGVTLTGNATIRFEYPDQDGDGVVDSLGIAVEALQIYRYDSVINRWRPLSNRSLNQGSNYIEAQTDTFSSFALLEGVNPSDTMVSGWNIIGYPGIAHETTPTGIFSDDVSPVYFQTYDEPSESFTDTSTLVPGRGYILWSDSPGTIDGYGSENYDDPVTVSLTRDSSDPLYAGYHFASNPFTSSINWNTVYADSTNIGNTYWEWDGSSYQFYVAGGGGGSTLDGTIVPWTGFWVRAEVGGGTLSMARPGAVKIADIPRNPAFDPTAEDWRVQISIVSAGLRDEFNYLGISPTSANGLDPFDVEDLGTLHTEDRLELSFPNPDPEGSEEVRYAQDVRSSDGSDLLWDFRITSTRPQQNLQMNFPNLHRIPANWKFFLTNKSTGGTYSIGRKKYYEFNIGDGTREFSIEAVNAGVLPTPTPVTGDLNEDEGITGLDLFTFAAHWKQGTPGPSLSDFQSNITAGDLDRSGMVDGADLVELMNRVLQNR